MKKKKFLTFWYVSPNLALYWISYWTKLNFDHGYLKSTPKTIRKHGFRLKITRSQSWEWSLNISQKIVVLGRSWVNNTRWLLDSQVLAVTWVSLLLNTMFAFSIGEIFVLGRSSECNKLRWDLPHPVLWHVSIRQRFRLCFSTRQQKLIPDSLAHSQRFLTDNSLNRLKFVTRSFPQ